MKALTAADIRATRLPVSGAFHTELVASAQVPLSAAIAGAHFAAPEFPVYSNTLGARSVSYTHLTLPTILRV